MVGIVQAFGFISICIQNVTCFKKSIQLQIVEVAHMGHGDRYIGSLFRVDEPVPDDFFNLFLFPHRLSQFSLNE